MTTLSLREEQVREIISLLRGSNNRAERYRWADELERRLSGSSSFICAGCGGTFSQSKGRPRKFCSDTCRQDAFRKKHGLALSGKKSVPWNEKEVETLISAIGQYYGTQHWAFGQRTFAWGAIAEEVGRTVSACQTKYLNLIRQGVVEEWGER